MSTTTKSSVSCAWVLTSAEAISLMEAKQRKKQEEIEVKEARKRERVEKKQQREEEAKRKAEEKERKAAERKKAQAEKEAERKRKAEEREMKRKQKADSKLQKRSLKSNNKENMPESDQAVGGGESSTPPDDGIMSTSSDQNECSICLGRYEDDLSNGVLQKEWVRCTNTNSCGLWMHRDCLSMEGNSYVCYICNVTFM